MRRSVLLAEVTSNELLIIQMLNETPGEVVLRGKFRHYASSRAVSDSKMVNNISSFFASNVRYAVEGIQSWGMSPGRSVQSYYNLLALA